MFKAINSCEIVELIDVLASELLPAVELVPFVFGGLKGQRRETLSLRDCLNKRQELYDTPDPRTALSRSLSFAALEMSIAFILQWRY